METRHDRRTKSAGTTGAAKKKSATFSAARELPLNAASVAHVHDPSHKWDGNGKKLPVMPPKPAIEEVPFRRDSHMTELRELLKVVKAMRKGDFSVRMPMLSDGIASEIGEVLNDIIELNENMSTELVRVRNIVGQEGRMTERVSIGSVKGAWTVSVDSINSLIGDLVHPTTEMARVITSVAKGDLSQKMTLEIDGRSVKGEFLRIGTTVNQMWIS